ncbi:MULTISPECIES: glycosyltransferase family 4 protein [Brucella/Ochrobactrum group]|uniref:Glycosyltransferase n=1 Tax=Ochrobactrum teleogrylli TaxID=2479765 RepID=A0ABY2Y0Z7_9HYPH|nr:MULTISPECIES: glycosyltransferase [Brucella]MCI1000411.1 glycosyltransferase [Ochrobactrum sp. C6C9]WHT45039.1 glycosyltransferase [Ochrobactrum sp. SSR]RLL74469.1 colanic acid biosynthesis glycosyltransferase WcaL [[Ochrobactrum] soli]TNV12539.1 glycosyltransferase [[Ochrobactrum] teleogrylli]WHS29486.1 glycosyltransferase [Brucella sp. NM4]
MSYRRKIVVVLKGYPRLSETFIAQELLGLEQSGFDLVLVALRRPTDKKTHPVHDEIRAPVHYLPEYLREEPRRVLSALIACMPRPGFWRGLVTVLKDFRKDPTRNRIRRFGQAAVLAAEWPDDAGWIHAHFIHTPASVAAYASQITGIGWTCSAHAKDIWTSPDWELQGKLTSTRWTVTCTHSGFDHLRQLGGPSSSVHLSYHGLDLDRFGPFEGNRSLRNGSDADDPVRILSVGRAVEKKGYDIVLRALSLLPKDLQWRFEHIGDGDRIASLKALADKLGIADKIVWKGALDQKEVLAGYQAADIFVLACRITTDGDRDGLPNVLVEASSQGLISVSTNISGVPELLVDGENGLLVAPEDPEALAIAMETAIRDADFRHRLGRAAEKRVRTEFNFHNSIRQLRSLFETEWQRSK